MKKGTLPSDPKSGTQHFRRLLSSYKVLITSLKFKMTEICQFIVLNNGAVYLYPQRFLRRRMTSPKGAECECFCVAG